MENEYIYNSTLNGYQNLDITITRKHQFMDRSLPMQVIINGHRAGILRNGQTETFHINGSSAELRAYLSMNKTLPFQVDSSHASTKEFLIQSSMPDFLFVIGTILVIISTILVLFTEQWKYMLIAAPPALYHLYIRFLLKDKYLVIKEVDKKAELAANPVKEIL